MESLRRVLYAGISCMVVFTFVSGTASGNVVHQILQRLEKIEDLNSGLKMENSKLELEINEIKRENRKLKQTVNEMDVWIKSGLNHENNKIWELNSDLKKEISNLGLEMAVLRDQMDDVRGENRELKQTVNAMNIWMRSGHISDNVTSKTETKNRKEPVSGMPYYQANEGRKENLIRSVKGMTTLPPPPDVTEQPVAFYAYMDTYHTPNLPRHTTLIFDTVKLNDGNGYNKHDGVFITPRTGVYAFHWSIKVDINSWASVEILVNGSPIGCASSDTLRVGAWGTGNELVVTHVNTGDHVFLRTQESAVGYLLSNHRARTSFSGWLIYS